MRLLAAEGGNKLVMAKKVAGGTKNNALVRIGAAVAIAAGFASAFTGRRQAETQNVVDIRDRGDSGGRSGEQVKRDHAHDRPSGIKGKLWDLGQKFRPLGIALEVQQRFGELNGNNLAAAVTLQAFIAVFPLLVIAVSIAGFVSAGGTDVAGSIVERLGLTGVAEETFVNAVQTAEDSRRAGTIVGFATLFWAALGLVSALQYGYDQVWQVQARGIKDKVVGLIWFLGFFAVAIASAVLGAILRLLPDVLAPLGILAGLGLNFAIFLWTEKILPNRDVGWKPLVPGAIAAAIGFEALKLIAAYQVPQAIDRSSQLYGSIGIVLALLAFMLLLGRLLIYAATLNVVLFERSRGTREVVLEVPATPGIVDDRADRTGQTDALDKDHPAAQPA